MEETALSGDYASGFLEDSDGPRLYQQWWRPGEPPKAIVVIVHGAAEHSDWYGHVGERLSAEGYSVCAFDLRGHGRSEGRRFFVE